MDSGFSGQGTWHAQLLQLLNGFGKIGKTGTGGICRLVASQADKQARDHLCIWLNNHEFSVQVDPIGNIFGVLDFGNGNGDRAFFCGSHLDSQPDGGNFDGALGVACACVAALYLKSRIDHSELELNYRYFVVVCWTGEEGARFQPSLIGSSVFAGKLDVEMAWSLQDAEGIRLKDALGAIGYLGSERPLQPNRYLEIHIEQGTRLEDKNDKIGLVEACWGAEKLRLLVTGKADHTGPTPMEDRVNALLAASHVVLEVESISQAASETLYSSVGRMELRPNSPNTVIDRAELWIEFRSAGTEVLKAAVRKLEKSMSDIGEQSGCTLAITGHESRPVVKFDRDSLALAADALDQAGIPHQPLDTIAGHDAIRMQEICPSMLLFVPSRNGITHSPDEFTSDEDVCAGFDGMAAVLSDLISRPESFQFSRSSQR